jgi:hypothetical protein
MTKKKTLAAIITAAVFAAGLVIASCEMIGDAGQTGTSRRVSDGSKILLSYTVLDSLYQNGALMKITGEEDATSVSVGTVDNPAATGIAIDPTLPDPVVFSFVNGGTLRELLVKIQSKGGEDSTCTVRLIDPTASPWSSLSGDITLGTVESPILRNPHGVAQAGDMLYFIDYESQQIVLLGTDELNLQTPSEYSPVNAPFDLTTILSTPNARGQAIIVIGNYLYALYLVSDNTPYPPEYYPSILVRMSIGIGGALTYDAKVNVGKNATEIVPVTSGEAVTLLIPAIGGGQEAGTSNGTASNISSVPAVGTWSGTAPVLLTGDAPSDPLTLYDIRAIAAPMPGNTKTDMLYILTASYTAADYNSVGWRLYQTSITKLLGAGGITLSQMVSAGNLLFVDEGNASGGSTYSGIYYWDILYENEASGSDRLWFVQGSPILATPAASYASPTVPGSYVYFNTGSGIGGENINSVDLTAETLSQAAAGVSLKRGFRLGRSFPEKHWY